ncbi:hypothetical protein JCM11491_004806 [Sporobolomyces phaffii]
MNRYAPVRPQPKAPRVDREKTCPSLLRVFVNPLHHHPDSAFTVTSVPIAKEFQVYVWRDSTLREVLLSLRDAAPHLRANSLAKYSLRLVFWDAKLDRYTSTDLAHITAKDLGTPPSDHRRATGAIDRTLSDAKYVVGDFIDVAYIVPGAVPAGGPAANGPQFAPLAAPPGPRGAPGGFQSARTSGAGPRPAGRGDTWAPTRPGNSGPGIRGGPPGGGGGGGGGGSMGGPRFGPGGGRPSPADQGWGNRRARPDATTHDAVSTPLQTCLGKVVATRAPFPLTTLVNLVLVLARDPVLVLLSAHVLGLDLHVQMPQEVIEHDPTLRHLVVRLPRT